MRRYIVPDGSVIQTHFPYFVDGCFRYLFTDYNENMKKQERLFLGQWCAQLDPATIAWVLKMILAINENPVVSINQHIHSRKPWSFTVFLKLGFREKILEIIKTHKVVFHTVIDYQSHPHYAICIAPRAANLRNLILLNHYTGQRINLAPLVLEMPYIEAMRNTTQVVTQNSTDETQRQRWQLSATPSYDSQTIPPPPYIRPIMSETEHRFFRRQPDPLVQQPKPHVSALAAAFSRK